jgi:hypothetical protein
MLLHDILLSNACGNHKVTVDVILHSAFYHIHTSGCGLLLVFFYRFGCLRLYFALLPQTTSTWQIHFTIQEFFRKFLMQKKKVSARCTSHLRWGDLKLCLKAILWDYISHAWQDASTCHNALTCNDRHMTSYDKNKTTGEINTVIKNFILNQFFASVITLIY